MPYDVVNTAEARALASDSLSFLHVSRAEIDLPADTDPYADAVYAQANKAFGELKETALEQEPGPAVYVYRQRMGQTRTDGRGRVLLRRRIPARTGSRSTRRPGPTRRTTGPATSSKRARKAVLSC